MKNVMINFGGLRGFSGVSYGDEKTHVLRQSTAMESNHGSRLTLLTWTFFMQRFQTIIITASHSSVQNPIAQLDEQHHLPIPAVSSLGASPTPAR